MSNELIEEQSDNCKKDDVKTKCCNCSCNKHQRKDYVQRAQRNYRLRKIESDPNYKELERQKKNEYIEKNREKYNQSRKEYMQKYRARKKEEQKNIQNISTVTQKDTTEL